MRVQTVDSIQRSVHESNELPAEVRELLAHG
jgi:hypothetical protein